MIVNNTIGSNSANGSGGGIFFTLSSPMIDGNLITGNVGALGGGGAQGGGIAGYGISTTVISNNMIIRNSAVTVQTGVFDVGGGGISLDNCGDTVLVVNNTLDGNSTVYGYGGGIFCDFDASPTIENNIVTNSPDGEGIWTSSVGSYPVIDYNNVWNNADGNYGGTAQPGESDIADNPLFADISNGNYHLEPNSPCVDVGDDSVSDLPLADFEGDDRMIDGDDDGDAQVDMGADEYVPIVIDRIRPRRCEPGERIRITGHGFGETQGDSVVHIGKREFDSDSSGIEQWTDDKIKVGIPKHKCKWFKDKDYRKQKVWITVHGIDSPKKRIKVIKPDSCP
jgi:hypothetical protein